MRCLSNSDMDLLFSADPTPDSAAERSTLLADVDGVTKRCAARGGARAMHMSTTEVARDMDVMRVLLGDPKLNFFGGSYGTFLGAIYADTFPQKVGRMVLDSAMSPNQTDQQEMTYDIQGFESSIDAFIDWCVARSDCALGSDKGSARQKIVDLLDQVEKHGLTTSKPGLTTIGEGWVGFSIFMCLYSDTSWPTLNKGLAQAFTGKGDILLAKGMSVVERNITGDYAPEHLPAGDDPRPVRGLAPVHVRPGARGGRRSQGQGRPPAVGPDDRRALRQLPHLADRRTHPQGHDPGSGRRPDPRHRQRARPGDAHRRHQAAGQGPRIGHSSHFRP